MSLWENIFGSREDAEPVEVRRDVQSGACKASASAFS